MFAQNFKQSLSSIRWLLLLLVFVLLFELLQMGWRFYIGRNLARRAMPFSRENPISQIYILVVGDSTAVGVGAQDPRDSIAGRLGKDYPNAEIVNLGKTGALISEVPEQLHGAKGKNFDLVLVQAGGNDILRFTELSQLKKDVTAVLEQARGMGDQVVLMTTGNVGNAPFFPRPIGWIYTQRTRAAREIFIHAAKDAGVIYVDLFTERGDDPFLKDPQKFHAPDMLHPSGEGYGIWYKKLSELIRTLND